MVVEKDPAAQAAHTVWPVVEANVPAAQAGQVIVAVEAEAVPTPHEAQALCPEVAANFPAGQSTHVAAAG